MAAAAVLGLALLTGVGVAAARPPVAAGLGVVASGGTWARAQEVAGVNAGGGAISITPKAWPGSARNGAKARR